MDKKLYEACKYQVVHNPGDCGMTLAELWHCIHHDQEYGFFWYKMTVAEYEDYLVDKEDWLVGKRTGKVLDDKTQQDYLEWVIREERRYGKASPVRVPVWHNTFRVK